MLHSFIQWMLVAVIAIATMRPDTTSTILYPTISLYIELNARITTITLCYLFRARARRQMAMAEPNRILINWKSQ